MFINGREKVGIKQTNLEASIDYSQVVGDVYENSEDYNATKK